MACSGKFAEHGCVPDVVDIAPPIQAQVSSFSSQSTHNLYYY